MSRRLWFAAVVLVAVGSACVNTDADEAQCDRADQDVLDVLQSKVTIDGTLRNASLHVTDGLTFVTAELHEDGDRDEKEGHLLTWVATADSSDEWQAVDVYARDDSSWPHASFDARRDGVIESRACAALWIGDTES